MKEQLNRGTFAEFIARHPEFQPVVGEEMGSVYRKQHDAFIAYVDECTGGLAQIKEDVERIKAFLVL